MFSRSSKTIRVSGIPPDAGVQDLEQYARELLGDPRDVSTATSLRHILGLRHEASAGPEPCAVSLAPQMSYQTGTVTFSNEASKKRALKVKVGGWACDDRFDWLTVLYSATSPDLDICAVHGLNGNAFDTWAANGKMWLRDFLPLHARFRRSRIMTFGYSSLIGDEDNVAGMSEWAHSLLTALATARKSEDEKTRPIIFICHSLGGLVVREAMVRLHSAPGSYPSLDVRLCGLLFLSTPHSGSAAADWNSYLVELAQNIGKTRARAVTTLLGSFNDESRKTKERFGLISPAPPYVCLGETRATKVKGSTVMDTAPTYIQVVDYLESVSRKLELSIEANLKLNQEATSGDNGLLIRGGDARGGSAQGAFPRGGNARGGGVSVGGGGGGSSVDRGIVRGGDATGGDAAGSDAHGGNANGGDVQFY
ncbi:hypothetical protein N3K66_001469 [Trichothecium roseum]|uniref:Uncharacterized protein n=1 Tax=Trichothecium roseum TaxID=47278 RepID=A0ACC0VGU8_9HYPO|nr:hypothetical protein N3K66_001469 [Trichothecium roseum]